MSGVQGGAAPQGGTLSDLWRLRAASRPPLCLVGSIKKPLALPVITVSSALTNILNSEVVLFCHLLVFLHKLFNKSKKHPFNFQNNAPK